MALLSVKDTVSVGVDPANSAEAVEEEDVGENSHLMRTKVDSLEQNGVRWIEGGMN